MGSVFTQLAQLDAKDAASRHSEEDSLSGSTEAAGVEAKKERSKETLKSDERAEPTEGDSLSGSTEVARPKKKKKQVKVKDVEDEKEKLGNVAEGTFCNFYGLSEEESGQLNTLPEEPEYYEVETTLDTGASAHAADRVDFPGYTVEESPGSKAGQIFGCAGGKSLANEGQMTVEMVSPVEGTQIKLCTQVTKVTRPLLSVSKITEEGKLKVLCDQIKAVIIDLSGKVLATFPKKNGLYVCMMRVKNPRYKKKDDVPFPRQHT
jgi:hypothetical protein